MAKAKVVSFGLRSKVFFSLISRDFHDLFFFLRNFLSTAWRVNRLQLPATEQVMIIICFACSNCRWNWVSEVEERLRFSGFQFIIFIAHMFQRRRQIESCSKPNWIKLNSLRKPVNCECECILILSKLEVAWKHNATTTTRLDYWDRLFPRLSAHRSKIDVVSTWLWGHCNACRLTISTCIAQ